MTKTCAANNIEQQLQQLALEARHYPDISLERQQKLDEIVRLVIQSNKLWIENTPYFEDALQQTWLYFCKNINFYNQNKCSVITWLNNCLKWRLRDFYIAETKQRARDIYLSEAIAEEKISALSTSTQDVASSREMPLILEEIYQWVLEDPHQDLQNVHIRGYPDATCQIIILRRLPPKTPWKKIAQEFKLPNSTAPNFYQRECLPRLRSFADQQGYLELNPTSILSKKTS